MSPHSPQSLAPNENLSKNDPWFSDYKETLDGVLRDPANRNISISGKTASGKSSILLSYDKNIHKRRTFLYISLRELQKKTVPPEKQEDFQKQIECFILQQILSRCSARDLNGSSVAEMSTNPRKFPILPSVFCFLALLCVAVIQLFDSFKDLIVPYFPDSLLPWIVPVAKALFAASIIYLILWGIDKFWGRFKLGEAKASFPNFQATIVPSAQNHSLEQYHDNLIVILENIAAKINFTLVIEDLEYPGPEISQEIITKLLALNKEINTYMAARGWRRCFAEWLRYPSWRHPLRRPPMRFIYAMEDNLLTPQQRADLFNYCINVNPAFNCDTCRNIMEGALLKRRIATNSSDINRVARTIAGDIPDYRAFNQIMDNFDFKKQIMRHNHPHRTSARQDAARQDAALLAITYYEFRFPDEYRIACETTGEDRFCAPCPEDANSDVASFLYEEGYLDSHVLTMLNSHPQNTYSVQLDILKSGSCKQCESFLDTLQQHDNAYIRREVVDDFIYLSRSDPEITRNMAAYLGCTPSFYIDSILCYLNHGYRPVYNLLHMRSSLTTQKHTLQRRHDVVSMKLNGELYFKNLLLCLSTFTEDELEAALTGEIRAKLNPRLEEWLDQYAFSSFHVLHFFNPGWEECWEDCARVLLMLLGDHWDDLPNKYRKKRLGRHSLQHYHSIFATSTSQATRSTEF